MRIRLPTLISLALLVALAALVSYWVIQMTAVRSPREPLVTIPAGDPVAQNQPLDTMAAASMFGPTSATQTPSRLVLIGIISEGGKSSGVALLSLDGQPAAAYRVGDPIDDNQNLAEVRVDRVIVRGAGGNREILMPERVPATGIDPVR